MICDGHPGCDRDTEANAWKKRWWRWGGRVVSELNEEYPTVDCLYVYCNKEMGYRRPPADIVTNIGASARLRCPSFLDYVVGILCH